MKIRNWIGLGLVVSTATLAVACGGKDNNGDGDSGDGDSGGETEGDGGEGNYSTDFLQKEIDALEKQIAELEDQLKTANEDTIPGLQDELDAANQRLDELETCANGGECDGVETGLALTVYSDAYCESVFACCSGDEARATLGQGAKDEDSCKSMFAQLLVRGNSIPNAPGMTMFDSYTFGQLAAALQTGRIQLDGDALEECAGGLTSVCPGGEPSAPAACAPAEESVCDRVFFGLQDEGEPCATPDECKDGLFCLGGNGGYADGVCVGEAKVDDSCQDEADCTTADGDLYCDENQGSCQDKGAEGDDCAFTDPTFNNVNPYYYSEQVLSVPCLPGLWCSPESNTCLATCDKLGEGDVCNNSDQCGDNLYCDLSELEDQGYAGECKKQLTRGAASTDPAACLSGGIYTDLDAESRCTGRGGEACSYDDYAGVDCNSGSCTEGDECRAKCDGQWDCGDDETCVNSICYEEVDSGTECLVTEQCPDNEWCKAGNCENRVKTGDPDDAADDCTVDEECAVGSACVPNDVAGTEGMDCRPYEGLGTGKFCTDWFHCSSGRCDLVNTDSLELNKCKATSGLGEAGDDCDMEDAIASAGDFGLASSNINLDPCGAGLFCKRSKPYSTDDFSGTCTEQLAPGVVCDRSLPGDVNQCTGNTTCATSPASGVLSCPVAYSEPEQNDKCVLGDSTFATSVAYGDFPVAAPVR